MTQASLALALVVLAPLIAAAASFVFPRVGRRLGWLTAAVIAGALVPLARHVLAFGPFRHDVGGWPPPLGIGLRADGMAVLLLGVGAAVGIGVTLYAGRYFDDGTGEGRHKEAYFWPLWLLLWAALNALFLAADIFNLYVTLELVTFTAVALVALSGVGPALTAALRYLLVSLAGSLFYLLGVALTYGSVSTVDLALIAGRVEAGPATGTALALMTAGLLIKAGLFPMHFWLPPAHASAPAPVSAALSGLVVKGAFVIMWRLWFEAFPAVIGPGAMWLPGALGAAPNLWGSVQALRQERLKLLIAYSTVAQLGYLFLVFPLASGGAGREAVAAMKAGTLVFLAGHASAKAAMFLVAGNILHAAGHDRIRDLDGIIQRLPISFLAFGLAGISLVGLPPSAGFVGKWLLLGAGLGGGEWALIIVILAGSLLAAAYVVRVLTHAFTHADVPAGPCPVPASMEWIAFALALAAVLVGVLGRWPIALVAAGPIAGSALP